MSSAQHSDDFYSQGKAYWETIPATVDGMLGGYSEISSIDIHSSNRLLKQFHEDKAAPLGRQRALDCGAGIGRITKHLLLPLFDAVDMVEQNQAFLDQARTYIGHGSERVENLFCQGASPALSWPTGLAWRFRRGSCTLRAGARPTGPH
uniref:Alpha N-terminal protein methyltransferase 1 n=1 Tax=Rhipicephalus zambeziensis TaxID=60191 RepID=A0A224YGV7_9ACAR